MSSHIPKSRMAFAGVFLITTLLGAIFVLTANLSGSLAAGTQAQAGCTTFKETGQSLCGRFLDYWRSHGGLHQFGYPLSGEFIEKSDLNGSSYTVQYFERAVFEYHPENKPPYEVLLSQLGTYRLQQKYPRGAPTQAPASTLAPGSSTPAAKGTQVSIEPDVVVELIDQEQAAETGLQTRPCGTEMTWVLKVTNLSTKPFTRDILSLKMVDSTGKAYSLTTVCGSQPLSGSFGQPAVLKPGDVDKGTITFDAANIPSSAKYLDLIAEISGSRVVFRYMLP